MGSEMFDAIAVGKSDPGIRSLRKANLKKSQSEFFDKSKSLKAEKKLEKKSEKKKRDKEAKEAARMSKKVDKKKDDKQKHSSVTLHKTVCHSPLPSHLPSSPLSPLLSSIYLCIPTAPQELSQDAWIWISGVDLLTSPAGSPQSPR